MKVGYKIERIKAIKRYKKDKYIGGEGIPSMYRLPIALNSKSNLNQTEY